MHPIKGGQAWALTQNPFWDDSVGQGRAAAKTMPCLIVLLTHEGFLCPFFNGNAKGGGGGNVAFEPTMNKHGFCCCPAQKCQGGAGQARDAWVPQGEGEMAQDRRRLWATSRWSMGKSPLWAQVDNVVT